MGTTIMLEYSSASWHDNESGIFEAIRLITLIGLLAQRLRCSVGGCSVGGWKDVVVDV